jgi:taurine dioxygenase
VRVVPLTPAIGAEIHGVDLSSPLSEGEVKEVRRAWLDHLVIFFRDQDLSPGQFISFARQFGEIAPPPFVATLPDHPEIMVLDQDDPRGSGGDRWHTDNTYLESPPMGSILRAVELPSSGGDTCFGSMYAAYEALSAPMQRFLEGLRAEHDVRQMLSYMLRGGDGDPDDGRREWPPVQEHPVIRTHPETGRKALFAISNFITRIAGLSDVESSSLLQLLFEHVRDPAFQCRFRWERGSIAFWDNRCAVHFAVPDYSERRLMHRITLEGDRPV